MNKETQNVITEKSTEFAIKVINLYKYLCTHKQEYVLSKQLLRSGTSIGANVREAKYAASRKDFVNKLQIALKEAAESEYWIELLYKTKYLSIEEYTSLCNDGIELIKILTSITKSIKNTLNQ